MELYSRLDALGVNQIIYVPEKKSFPEGTNDFPGQNTRIVSSIIVRRYHSFLYFNKIKTIKRDLEGKIKLTDVDCCIATNLFSDGGVAYKIKQKYGIPYIVAIRATDVNFFLKMPYMWPVARNILKEAEKVVYIGPAIKKKLYAHISTWGIRQTLEKKSLLLPNGINKFWLDNINLSRKKGGHTVIYVGRFMKNKNIENLLKAVLLLRNEIPDIQLYLVGGGGELEEKVHSYARMYEGIVSCKGRVDDKNELIQLYRNSNVFAMISKRETFGLVYVEALSQGLPILYTRDQGVDGFFSKRVGESVIPSNVNQIKDALKNLLLNTEDYNLLSIEELGSFNWDIIAKKYYGLINDI